MNRNNEKRLLVLDGNSLLFRAFYATYYGDPEKIMRTRSGQPSNAIFAFANMLAKFLSSLRQGDAIFLAFDADSKTFRKEEFASYKANRKPAPEELCLQFGPARELVSALGIPYLEMPGFEADDLAGTAAKLGEEAGYKVEIYTSDQDYLQLISDSVTVHLVKKGLSDLWEMTPEKMQEVYGFPPKAIIDFKGLRGDSSDNLPGIPGVGDKRATSLIQEYGDFDAILSAAKEGKIKGKLGTSIADNEAMGRLCYELATIKTDVELSMGLEDFLYRGYSLEEIRAFAERFELKTLLSRLPKEFALVGSSAKEEPLPERENGPLPSSFPRRIGLAFDLDEEDYHSAPILGIGVAFGGKRYSLSPEEAKANEAFLSCLRDPEIAKDVYDGKKILIGAKRLGIEIQGIAFDLLLASHLLTANGSSKADDLLAYFGKILPEEQTGLFEEARPERSSSLAFYALSLRESALKKLEESGEKALFEDVEMPLSAVLAEMECEGFPLDKALLNEIGDSFRSKKDALEAELIALAGHPFNPASPKQVAALLYDELGLKGPKSRSTSVETLSSLLPAHPLVGKILEYRKYAKLVGTYIDGLLPHAKEDGKIHTIFHQALTATGRLSSSNPNLQNISTRDEESKEIRKAFHYPDGQFEILSLDYAQIELRLLAHLSSCPSYRDIFLSGRDLHEETARKIFNLSPEEAVPGELRRKAKAINFAIVYGTTPFGLSEQIGCSPAEASRIIASFYRAYPEILSFLQRCTAQGEKEGYVTTILGRRRYLPELKDGNYMRREAAKRMAMNAPVQGSAADLIKVAMIRAQRLLKDGGYRSKMVLQIHDELLFAVKKEERDELLPKLKEAMEQALPLSVKLSVDGYCGPSWYDAKD